MLYCEYLLLFAILYGCEAFGFRKQLAVTMSSKGFGTKPIKVTGKETLEQQIQQSIDSVRGLRRAVIFHVCDMKNLIQMIYDFNSINFSV